MTKVMGRIRFLCAIQLVKRSDDRKGFVVRNRHLAKTAKTLPKRLGGLPSLGRNLKNHGWQRTMTKVGKSDGEGTFRGPRGNDEVAP
jgi:hypothetical protein